MAVISKNNIPKLILLSHVKKNMTQEQIQMLQESFVPVICDLTNLKILQSAMGERKTPSEIIRETHISQTTCYRRIKVLYNLGLLKKVGVNRTEAYHEECYYQSVTEHIEVFIANSKFKVSIL